MALHHAHPGKHPSSHQTASKIHTTNSIEHWVEKHLKTPSQHILPHEIGEQSAAFLGRFGLKTPKAIDAFLKTPAGKTIIQELRSELYEKKLISETQIAQYTAHELLLKRIKMALYQWDTEKLTRHQHLNLLLEEELQQTLERSHQSTALTSIENKQERYNALNELLHQYEQHHTEALEQLNQLKHEEENLVINQQLLDAEEPFLNQKYALYTHYLNDDFLSTFLSNKEGELIIDEIIKAKDSITTKIETLFVQLKEKIEQHEIHEQLIHTQHAYHLQLHVLENLLSVHQKEKIYLDSFANQVKNPLKAHFILKKEEVLIYENGEYYLLNAKQDWSLVKQHPEERQQAKEHFERSESAILTMKPMLAYQKKTELTALQQQSYRNTLALSLIKSEQAVYENQLRLIQSMQAQIQSELTKELTTQNSANLAPRPAPSITGNKIKISNKIQPSITYKKKLNELKNQPMLTQQDLTALANLAPGENADKAKLFVKDFFAHPHKLNRQQRILLLAAMERFGTLPVAQKSHQAENAPLELEYKSPTPFNKSPNPYKQ